MTHISLSLSSSTLLKTALPAALLPLLGALPASAREAALQRSAWAAAALPGLVADSAETDSVFDRTLTGVTVKGSGRSRRTAGAVNATHIGQEEMFRAACCNLGESFVTNPSVDVSYDDAATGTSQIKLLGLSGLYVQMLAENMPAFRGAAQPFALGYVPGTWMRSINVSKGAASVKNGFESITGQIDIDYLKPDEEPKINANLYTNSRLAFEVNADANVHIKPNLATNLLVHYQDDFRDCDDNHDGFMDMPMVRQINAMNHWWYRTNRYILHAGFQGLSEERRGGQIGGPFGIGIGTQRIEAYMKHAFIIDPNHGANIAFMTNASWHGLDADYGNTAAHLPLKHYDVEQSSVNAQLIYETHFTERHALSAGLSLLYDDFDENLYRLNVAVPGTPAPDYQPDGREVVPGAYAQYTFTPSHHFTLMAGLRYDYDDRYDGGFCTPRMHLKWSPSHYITFRAASGMGYRTPHALAENHNLLASGRFFTVRPDAGAAHLDQEAGWNSGISAAFSIPFGERLLRLNAEYFYTYFLQQTVIDYEHTDGQIVVHNLRDNNVSYSATGHELPKSYSHVFQIDAQMELFPGFDVTAAFRHNTVRCTYGDASAAAVSGAAPTAYSLRERVLTPRYKALLSLSYQTPLKLWQFDATLCLNGGGRLPDGTVQRMGTDSHGPASVYSTAEGDFFRPYEQLTAQVTRRFRHIDVYLGGENLTNRRQPVAIMSADAPFSQDFEPTLTYAPVQSWMLYAGLRLKF